MRLALRILALIALALALLGLLEVSRWFPGYFHGGGLGALAPFLASLLLLAATVAVTLALDVLAVVAASMRRQWGWLAAVLLVTLASAAIVYLAYAPTMRAGSQAATPGGGTLEYRMAADYAFLASFAALLAPPLVGLVYSFFLDRGRSRVAVEHSAAHGLLMLSFWNYVSLVLVATVQPFRLHGSAALWFSRFTIVSSLLIWLLGLGLILMASVLAFRRREWGWFWGLLGALPLGMLALPMQASPVQHLLIALVYSFHVLTPITGFMLYLKLALVTLTLPLVPIAYAMHAVRAVPPAATAEASTKPA